MATSLMEMLPPVEWADVATRHDMALLRQEFKTLRHEMAAMHADFAARIEKLLTRQHATYIGALFAGVGAFAAVQQVL